MHERQSAKYKEIRKDDKATQEIKHFKLWISVNSYSTLMRQYLDLIGSNFVLTNHFKYSSRSAFDRIIVVIISQ